LRRYIKPIKSVGVFSSSNFQKMKIKDKKIIYPIPQNLILPESDNGIEIKNTSKLSNEELIEKVSQIFYGCLEFSSRKDPNKF